MQSILLIIVYIAIILRFWFADNIVFILKIRLFLYKIAVKYLLSPFFYAIFSTLKDHFFTFFPSSQYNHVYLRYYLRYTVDEIRDFIIENFNKRIGFSKESSYYSMHNQKKKIYNCLQLNKQKQCQIFIMLKNTTNHC